MRLGRRGEIEVGREGSRGQRGRERGRDGGRQVEDSGREGRRRE